MGLSHRTELPWVESTAIAFFAFARRVKSVGMERKSREHEEEEYASLASKGRGKWRRQCQPSPRLQPDSSPRSGVAADCFCFKPVIKWFEWLPVPRLGVKQGDGGQTLRKGNVPSLRSLWRGSLGFVLRVALLQSYSPDRDYWSFSAMLQQFRKLLWCYSIFVPGVFVYWSLLLNKVFKTFLFLAVLFFRVTIIWGLWLKRCEANWFKLSAV